MVVWVESEELVVPTGLVKIDRYESLILKAFLSFWGRRRMLLSCNSSIFLFVFCIIPMEGGSFVISYVQALIIDNWCWPGKRKEKVAVMWLETEKLRWKNVELLDSRSVLFQFPPVSPCVLVFIINYKHKFPCVPCMIITSQFSFQI